MGRIVAPFGIKGWVKVQPYVAGGAASFRNYRTWFLQDEASKGAGWRQTSIEAMEVHGDLVAARLQGYSDRDAAALLKGRVLAVPREAFPAAAEGEYYWADLIGLPVRNSAGQDFGTVAAMMETGANDVIVARMGQEERLIPFIANVVKRVQLASSGANGVIEVDWELDY